MKIRILLFLFGVLALCGCASVERFGTDAALGAGGGFLASELSDGNPGITAAGAVGGIAVGEGIHALRARQNRKAYADGYTRGRADGVKSLYWDLVDQHKNPR